MPPIVEVEDLVVRYDPTIDPAVDHVSFSVGAGEVLGILGGNGAGKTTTLRALAGVRPPTSGKLTVSGLDLSDAAQVADAQGRIGYCPDTAGLIRQATVREHVALTLTYHQGPDAWPAALDLVDDFGLGHVLDRETTGFSHGMSRRLSVLLAALAARDLLILDEPFDGVDPVGVAATKRLIARAQEAGMAVIVSTHLLPLLTEVSDRVAVMVAGHIVDEGPASVFAGRNGQARYDRALSGAGQR
jgi:ABC-2 type transport system ATP-binding protein